MVVSYSKLFLEFLRDFLVKSRITFFFSKADDLNLSCININGSISLNAVRIYI